MNLDNSPRAKNSIKNMFSQRNQILPLSSWESSQKTEDETMQFKLTHKSPQHSEKEETIFKLSNRKVRNTKTLDPIQDFENVAKIEKRLSYYSTKPADKERRKRKRNTLTPSEGMDMYVFISH